MKHKHADLIHAYADGAKIEYSIDSGATWKEVSNPSFYNCHEYRIKPEPVVLYVNEYKTLLSGDRYGSGHLTREGAESMITNKCYIRTIKLMEVEDNE